MATNTIVQKPDQPQSIKSPSLTQITSGNKNVKSPKRGTIGFLFDAIVKRKLSPEIFFLSIIHFIIFHDFVRSVFSLLFLRVKFAYY